MPVFLIIVLALSPVILYVAHLLEDNSKRHRTGERRSAAPVQRVAPSVPAWQATKAAMAVVVAALAYPLVIHVLGEPAVVARVWDLVAGR